VLPPLTNAEIGHKKAQKRFSHKKAQKAQKGIPNTNNAEGVISEYANILLCFLCFFVAKYCGEWSYTQRDLPGKRRAKLRRARCEWSVLESNGMLRCAQLLPSFWNNRASEYAPNLMLDLSKSKVDISHTLLAMQSFAKIYFAVPRST